MNFKEQIVDSICGGSLNNSKSSKVYLKSASKVLP